MNNKKFRVGIIGCGDIVESNHLPVLKALPSVEVCWIYDKNPKRMDLLSKMYSVQSISETQLEHGFDRIDICLLTIPYGVRKSYIEACAAKKIALYVEKPFALTVAEHSNYCGLFSEEKLSVGLQKRCYKYVAQLKAIIKGNYFGKLKKITFNQGFFTLKGGGSYLSNAALSGGGVIIESAVHTIDQILQLTEAKKVNVLEAKSFFKNGIDYDTKFTSTLILPENETVEVVCNVSTLKNLDNGLLFEFEQAKISCTPSIDTSLQIISQSNNVKEKLMLQFQVDYSAKINVYEGRSSLFAFWTLFIEAISTGKPNITSGVNSLLTTEWVEKVYQIISNK